MTTPAVANLLLHRLSVRRCTATGAIVLGTLFVMCWLGGAAGLLGSSHMFVALFTTAPLTSAAAIASGLFWSLIFGAITCALTALAYNAFPALKR
jgi:hypothetical protein